ncbi:MAG: hypothetical protein KC486_12825 [Myxococcales bacterium]|nr:hypothetical protein [Myxococcales bacterium]
MSALAAPPVLSDAELRDLDAAIERALEAGDESAAGLELLGYGEISCVVAWRAGDDRVACKRLPVFAEAATLERYQASFTEYLERLAAGGVTPVASGLQVLPRGHGAAAVYCVQPRLAGDALVSRALRGLEEDAALALFDRLLDAIEGVTSATVGLDGQLSNWALVRGELRYLDVTTPMLRDGDGGERMPVGVFLASLPWALRGIVRRWMLRPILDKYYDPRGVVLDLLGNLHKERLAHLLPAFLDRANARPGLAPALTQAEVDRYYAADARDWALLQRLRRLDRAWQRRVRRRTYPFLLPGAIER